MFHRQERKNFMETIKCKECGKELSSKAEICPNCGVRIKKKSFISKVFRFFEIIGVLIVIGIICVVVYSLIRDLSRKNRENSYVGIWELVSKQGNVTYSKTYTSVGVDETYTIDYTIIIDDKLNFEKDNVYYGIGGGIGCAQFNEPITKRCNGAKPVLLLNENDKIFAINFNTTGGDSVYLCFKNTEKNTIKQVSCKGANSDKYNDSLYSMNGGIDEDFDIVYKKVK